MKQMPDREFYNIRSILGNDWAMFYFLLGAREAGKSYAVTDFFCNQFVKYGRPFYWLRLSDLSAKKLLQNNADKLIDPDLKRKYHLDLITNGSNVYRVLQRDKKTSKITKKVLMARVFSLATFYNDKGSGIYDKDFLLDPNMYYNIALDEMNREESEKHTFDIVYNFVNQMENLVRSTKQRLRVICIGNTLDEASDLLTAFNFIPVEFGRYYIRKKRAVIDYMCPSKKYQERRKGTISDLLTPDASTFSNKNESDASLVSGDRLRVPMYIIQFYKNDKSKYTVWNDRIIARYNGEKCKRKIAMRPYLDVKFIPDDRNNVIQSFDDRMFLFHNLLTYKEFKKDLEYLKKNR